MASITDCALGLMMGKSRPCAIASVRNPAVIFPRAGRPKEIFDTPNTQCSPSRSRTICMAFNVSTALSCSAETVSVRQSINTSSLRMPCFRASDRIRSAIAKRPSAVGGMPPASIASPTTAAPYFFASGKMRSSTACSPLTELIIALPLTTRKPASIAAGSEESS